MDLTFNSNYISEIFFDDTEYALEMLNIFLESNLATFELIETEISSGNFPKIKELAHQIKPSFMMVGFPSISDEIKDLEIAASQSNTESVALFYKNLKPKIEKVSQTVKSEILRLSALL